MREAARAGAKRTRHPINHHPGQRKAAEKLGILHVAVANMYMLKNKREETAISARHRVIAVHAAFGERPSAGSQARLLVLLVSEMAIFGVL